MADEETSTYLTTNKQNRLDRYMRKGNLTKLKDFLKEHYIDIRRVIFPKRRNALHLACKYQQKDIIKYLLKHDVNPLLKDVKGNVPLLTSALKTLNHRRTDKTNKINELLITACKKALKIRNDNYLSAQDVFEFVRQKDEKKKKKKKKVYIEISSSDSSESEDSDVFSDFDSEESDSEWFVKMQMEFEDVYFQEFGKFENDFLQFEQFQSETYDNWTNRMQNEYNTKKRKQNESHYHRKSKKRETHEEPVKNNLKNEFKPQDESTKFKIAKKKYIKQCDFLFVNENNEIITIKSLPTPNEMLIKIILTTDGDENEKKHYLKKQQVKWHPDKFLQKCGHRLNQTERDEILDRVNRISQIINSYLDATS